MTFLALLSLAEEFRLRANIAQSLQCLTAASLLQDISKHQKARANMLIGKLLAQYGRNRGTIFKPFSFF